MVGRRTGSDVPVLLAFAIAVLLVNLVVALHYEALRGLHRLLSSGHHRHNRRAIVVLILGAIATHTVEIAIFGTGMWLTAKVLDGIALVGMQGEATLVDYVYFAATAYTTVGFGDLVPSPGLRLLTTAAALTGLVCVTWTASLSYLHMQRHWEKPSDA